jgi:hypothetical protein
MGFWIWDKGQKEKFYWKLLAWGWAVVGNL